MAKHRGRGEGSGGWRKDGRYAWRITLPGGKRRSFYGKDKADAKAKADQALRDVEHGLDLAAGNPTVKAYLHQWLTEVAADQVRPSTLRSYSGHIRVHLVPALGSVRLRDLTPQQVNTLLADVAKTSTPATANKVRATLRSALATAIKWGMVTRNAAALADPRRQMSRRVEPLEIDQITALLRVAHDHRYGPLIQLAVTTGLRQGELLALRWGPDVDIEHGILHVHHGLASHQGRPSPDETPAQRVDRLARQRTDRLVEPKTEMSRRRIRLSQLAIDALERQWVRVGTMRDLAGLKWTELDLVFPTRYGTFADGPTVTRELQRILEDAGLPRQRFHDLRHAAASLQFGEGADMFAVKELLGHSQIHQTANTYGHMSRKLNDETATRMDRALTPNVTPIRAGLNGQNGTESPKTAVTPARNDTKRTG